MAKKLQPVHPGEVLSEVFMKPYGLSMNKERDVRPIEVDR
jgi:plasmid maintenance system antidote protein VapI